jgi:hypothetical protein
VPVWHERTREARAAGELTLIGIAEEQHPDRCALFAQWQGLDWPILWDPFNLTGSSAVPVAIGIDEHGIVRTVGLTLERFDEFMAASFEADGVEAGAASGVGASRGPRALEPGASPTPDAALARLLWSRGEGESPSEAEFQACLDALEREAARSNAPSASFRLGVARRLRYDSPAGLPADFQASLDLWGAALRGDPSQYIWRRRIQQWGPRLDKPYPFYGWIEQAAQELRARGESPVEVQVALTSSEVSGRDPLREAAPEAAHPDPEGEVPRDSERWISIDVAVVPHTGAGDGEKERAVQVHIALRPSATRAVHWNNDAGPSEVWFDDAAKAGLAPSGYTLPSGEAPTSSEPRFLDFTLPDPIAGQSLRGTAFYFVCEGEQGECRFMAQDFELVVPSAR